MSGYTNAVTNITDESQYYVYPMAASLRGGAVESEYNIRNLMTCLFNKSAAKQDEDFIVYYNKSIEGQRPTLETHYDNANWYNIDLENGFCIIHDLAVGPGEGNCNGYYTRLHDFTPINNTALNIKNLQASHAGYVPLLPSDLAPTLPVAKNNYNSKDLLVNLEREHGIDEVADYVVEGQYIDGTSVRIRIDAALDTYVYYTKIAGSWEFSSDIVAIYQKRPDDSQAINEYRVYADGKYFYKNPTTGDIEIIVFDGQQVYTDTSNDNRQYITLDGELILYKIDVSYQNFNIVLGLNWTTNQLVSSAQVTICEDTTPVKYITETDIDGDTTQYAYTEYGILNKNLKDRGLLDAGILLGTIRIKKTPIYNIIDGQSSYTYEYSCTYEGNRYKTACIDLSKLGTDTDTLGENMYDKIARLYNLMIDSGSFKISSVMKNSGFDTNPESINHDFVKCIAPYRLDLGITDFESGVGQDYINGYLRFINYDENVNSASEVTDGYIFKCRVRVDSVTGQVSDLESLTLYNDAIECFDTCINFNRDVNIGLNETGKRRNLFVSGTLESIGLIQADAGINIGDDKKISFTGSTSTLSADSAGLKTNKFTVTSSFIVPQKTNIPSGEESLYDGPTIEIIPGRVKINTRELDINSTDGTITTAGNISTTKNMTAANITATGNITGSKVYGAVWM